MSVVIDYTNGLEIAPLGDKVGTVDSSGAIDLSTGSVFNFTPTGNTTFSFNNTPSSGAFSFCLNVYGGSVGTSYDIVNASYITDGLFTQEGSPRGLFIKPDDGTKLYISGWSDFVYQYSLTTPWDASTLTYDNKSHDCGLQTGAPTDVEFHPDGNIMFVMGASSYIFHYDLSTPWDVSTASFTKQSNTILPGGSYGLRFKQDGTKYYTISYSDSTWGSVTQWDMSTPWDIATSTYGGELVLTNIGEMSTGLYDVDISSDGTKAFILSFYSNRVYEYPLSTAWDITSGSVYTNSFSVATDSNSPKSLHFGNNGTSMYVLRAAVSNNRVVQYSTGIIAVEATLSFPGNIQWSSGTTPVSPGIDEIDSFIFTTTDGGLTWTGYKTGDNLS